MAQISRMVIRQVQVLTFADCFVFVCMLLSRQPLCRRSCASPCRQVDLLMPIDARKPGRPLDMAKREAIIDATRSLMNSCGAAFTVDMVAEQAGVSKQTVYNNFSGKDDLIVHVVESIVQEIGTDLEAFSETDDVRTALIAFGSRYLRMVGNKDRTNFLRLIIGAAAGCCARAERR
jgi:AcrR family transcriptional regulator